MLFRFCLILSICMLISSPIGYTYNWVKSEDERGILLEQFGRQGKINKSTYFLLRTYIDVSIVYCLVFPIIFLYYGAFWSSITQFFCGLALICARLALHYKYFTLTKFVALSASYISVTTQMLIYLPREMGFHYLYLALLIVAVLLFQFDNKSSRIKLSLFTLLIVVSFFACEFFGMEVYKFLFPLKAVRALYIASILGMMIGPVLILLGFSVELEKAKKDLEKIKHEREHPPSEIDPF